MSTESRRERRKRLAAERQLALTTQVGGEHYKGDKIQHVEFCQMNRLPWCESAAIKYVLRHRRKNGKQDLEKAIHYIELLIAIDYGRTGEAKGQRYDGRRVPKDIKPKEFLYSVEEFITENAIPEQEARVITDIVYHQKNGDSRLMDTVKLLKEMVASYDVEAIEGMDLL